MGKSALNGLPKVDVTFRAFLRFILLALSATFLITPAMDYYLFHTYDQRGFLWGTLFLVATPRYRSE